MSGQSVWEKQLQESLDYLKETVQGMEYLRDAVESVKAATKILRTDLHPLPEPIWCPKCRGQYDEAMRVLAESYAPEKEYPDLDEYEWESVTEALGSCDGNPGKAFALQCEWLYAGKCIVCGEQPEGVTEEVQEPARRRSGYF